MAPRPMSFRYLLIRKPARSACRTSQKGRGPLALSWTGHQGLGDRGRMEAFPLKGSSAQISVGPTGLGGAGPGDSGS